MIAACGWLVGTLGAHVVADAATLALSTTPATQADQPKLSLVEKRKAAMASAHPRRGRWARTVVALKPPAGRAGTLALAIDVAEASDLLPPPPGVTVPPLALADPLALSAMADIRHNQKRIKSAQLRSSTPSRKRRPSAADEFNRRFGVLVAGPQLADARY
jgi:hypothetical protein